MSNPPSNPTRLRLLRGTPSWLLPVPGRPGAWHRDGDSIVAEYRRGDGDGQADELAVAVWVWEAWYGEEEEG